MGKLPPPTQLQELFCVATFAGIYVHPPIQIVYQSFFMHKKIKQFDEEKKRVLRSNSSWNGSTRFGSYTV
jgi:hypothetical protein